MGLEQQQTKYYYFQCPKCSKTYVYPISFDTHCLEIHAISNASKDFANIVISDSYCRPVRSHTKIQSKNTSKAKKSTRSQIISLLKKSYPFPLRQKELEQILDISNKNLYSVLRQLLAEHKIYKEEIADEMGHPKLIYLEVN